MTEAVQGILPMSVEEVAPKGSAPKRRNHYKGVANAGPSNMDMFQEGDETRRKGSIAGLVTKIWHANMETGFHILRVRLDDGHEVVTFVGPCEPVSEGDRVEAVGVWERHARYGQQLKARFIRALVPSTGAEIFAFLKGGGIKGVGVRSAEKLYSHFGDRLIDAINSPTALVSSGITEKQANSIATAWLHRSTHTEVIAFLQSLSVGPATADKIIKKYGDRTRQIVVSNPYRVAKDISGLGFKLSDQMFLAQGYDRADERRVDACIIHVMGQLLRDGHCACKRQRIVRNVVKELSIDEKHVREGIVRLIDKRFLIEEENGGSQVIYESGVLKCEEELAEKIVRRVATENLPDDIDEMIATAASDIGIAEIHEHQALAVKTSLGARFSVITGGPGAGKTSSLEVMLRVFEKMNPGCKILLCAPTGRAAQKMSESTNREARTIHRMLEWAPDQGGFQRTETNPLDADLLVADETSMLDIWLARDVLRAAPEHAKIVFVGDVDQLASVGPGRVLGDIIESGVVPVTRLTRIFRQGAGSQIAEAAAAMNAGRMPNISRPAKSCDMWAVYDMEPEDSLPKISKLVSEIAPSLGFNPLKDVQVLTAGHNGVLGTINLNLMLQEALNPAVQGNVGVQIAEKTFRAGDRVIQMANNYDLDVFNGDIGQVTFIQKIGRDGLRMTVAFEGRDVEYTGPEAKQLSLAYAISVHKSQGSEFPVVIFVPTTQHFTMLKKPLIYTAVTRARKLCALVGSERAAKISVKNRDEGRVTGLAKRLAIEKAEVLRMAG